MGIKKYRMHGLKVSYILMLVVKSNFYKVKIQREPDVLAGFRSISACNPAFTKHTFQRNLTKTLCNSLFKKNYFLKPLIKKCMKNENTSVESFESLFL